MVISILKDVFGVERTRRKGSANKLIFNKDKFDRLDNVYKLALDIKIGSRKGSNRDSGSTCHRRFQQWILTKVFQRLRIRLLELYDDLGIKMIMTNIKSHDKQDEEIQKGDLEK
jgi:hypothetical protein